MEMATGYKNTQKIIASTNQQIQYTPKINAVKMQTKAAKYYTIGEDNNIKQQQKIKIYINNKLENIKFLINLYLNIILCISKIKQNNSMLKTIRNQQTCIIKWPENVTIFSITLQFIRKIIWNFLTKLKIHSGIIENVKIKKILHIVRHFVGICLIRLISFKILQQIPENHQEQQGKLLTWQIVGNAQNKNQTINYGNNIKSILCNNHRNEKENWLLRYNLNQVATQTYKIVGNSENYQNYCFSTSQYIENEEDMLQTKKIDCYQVGNSQAGEIYHYKNYLNYKVKKQLNYCHRVSRKGNIKWQIVGSIYNNNQYKSSYLTTKCEIMLHIKKRECHQVGNSQDCLINKNYLYFQEKTQRHYYHHLSRRRKSEIAQNSTLKENYNERYLCERGIEENAKSRLYFHYLSQIKKFYCQKVGNSRNKGIKENAKDSKLNSRQQEKDWIYRNFVSTEIDNNFNVSEAAEGSSQFYLKHLYHVEVEFQRVGNYQGCRNFNEINYFPSRNINEVYADCHRLRKRGCYLVGNAKNHLTRESYKNFKENERDQENIQLCYIGKVNYESVANFHLLNDNYFFSRDIEKYYFGRLSHIDKILHQINSQRCEANERHVNIKEECIEIKKKQPVCCCYLSQAMKIRYQKVGNALSSELKQTEKDICLKRKERNYEIVGNSYNYIYSNGNYTATENERDENSKPHFDNYYQSSQAAINFHTKVGNSQIHQLLNNSGTLIIKEAKEGEPQLAYKNKLSLVEKTENQLVGNSLNCKYLKDINRTMKNVKRDEEMFLYPNNENKKTKRQRNNNNQLSPTKNRELKKVGNITNCQYLTNYAVIENVKQAEQKYLFDNYHGLNQVPDNTYKIVDNTQIFLNETENELLYHTKDKHKKNTQSFFYSSQNYTHAKFNHRQNQHFKQQVNCEPECRHFSVLYMFYYYFCWHAVCGFPLKSREFFKYLNDLIVRKLTWLKTLPSVADYNNDAPSSLCGRKLTKPTRKVKADIIANQQDCVKISQTSMKRTKSTFTTTVASLSSLHCSTSACSFSSSLSATSSSRMNLATTTPYCHNQQQPHHHHHHYNHYQTSPTTTTTTTNRTTSYLKLPSLLLLSRTLIILILLSSLWHTSEGFHSTGVKLSPNTVKTKYGLVRGIVVRSSPSLVEAYLGIPYASPPVGSLRFMPPITPSTWKNVRNADRFSPVCPQTVPIPPNGPEALLEVPRARLAQLRRLLPLLSNQSEDCLYLNIYAPYENRRHRRFTTNSGEPNSSPKLPTILFIHGESYEWNSGNPYDGSELAAHGNVIVVTINFRLGIFGFLKTGGKESAQGNFGLMDLVAGLHWLKENLPAFGGDPQAITLLGHGTGAALANILMVSPVASDLIQHSVLVSGSALSPWAIQKNPLFVKRRVAEQTGCHGDMLYDDLAPCLRTKTANELLAVKIDHPRFLVGFAPFIDGTVISPNSDSIGKLSLPLGSAIVSTSGIEFANFPKRNLIFCLTSVESHLDLSAQDLEFGFNETRRDRILRTYVRNNFHYHLNEIFAVLKNEYTDWDKAIRSPLSSRDATLQFLSDGHTASSLIKLGYMHSLRGGRGYFLHFKHRTIEEEYPQRTGSVRGEDVPFWLGLPISPLFPHNYTTQEKQISRLMLRYLANFAKTGNPNQSSVSSPLPSSSSLIGTSSSSSPSTTSDDHQKVKRSSSSTIENSTSLTRGPIVVDVATATAREALNLAVLYNQRRTKRTYNKRHSRSNDDHSGSDSNEMSYISNANSKLDGDELPFWDAYDVVNQLYMELGNKAEIQSHYRGHKLSMWLNLIPQLHRHANMNDQSMRHHQFQDDLNNMNLYEGIVRAQTQIKPADDEETLLLPKGRTTPPPVIQETNTTQKPSGGTTECGVDGAMFVAEMTTTSPSDNRSLVMDSREKEMATASTGLIGNLEVLRRLSGKQFQSYTTALVATVAVGCFLLILNILIFAGIYHQREKRARDAKTKEELQDNDTSKNSSMLKLNAMGSETGSFNDSGAGVSGKTTVVFGEYSCYDEKSLQTKDEKLIVELPPPQMLDSNWAACSTSTLDLLKTKHHVSLEATFPLSNVVPITTTEHQQTEHLMAVNALEMSTYNPLPMGTGLIIDPSISAAATSTGLLSKRGSFIGSSSQLNQYDFASVQSSDQMSFKDIENAVKVSVTRDDDITQDDDIPEPPPPPRSFQIMQQQQAQHNLQLAHQQQGTTTSVGTSASGSSGGGILRQAGTSSATQTGGGKKRVHIQEISV